MNLYAFNGFTWKPSAERGKPPKLRGNDALFSALKMYGELSVTDLAIAMDCSVGESSKRVKMAHNLLNVRKVGRKKMVSQKEVRLDEWLKWRYQ